MSTESVSSVRELIIWGERLQREVIELGAAAKEINCDELSHLGAASIGLKCSLNNWKIKDYNLTHKGEGAS